MSELGATDEKRRRRRRLLMRGSCIFPHSIELRLYFPSWWEDKETRNFFLYYAFLLHSRKFIHLFTCAYLCANEKRKSFFNLYRTRRALGSRKYALKILYNANIFNLSNKLPKKKKSFLVPFHWARLRKKYSRAEFNSEEIFEIDHRSIRVGEG